MQFCYYNYEVHIVAVLQGVLLEEINRLEKNINAYEDMLSNLPRGSIFIRQIGNSFFVYRKRKEKGKVISIYLGNLDDEKVKKEIELSQEYKRIKNNIRIARNELNKIRKAYKAYNRYPPVSN